jgi:hypothetical protein
MVTVHAPVPEQPPVQPSKTDPDPGVEVSWTDVPLAKYAWQAPPCGNWQLIPGGLLVTVPVPLVFPVRLTVRDGFKSKVATIWRSALMVRSQAVVPEQAPVQPTKREVASGVGVITTLLPDAKLAEQAVPWLPQVIPAGLLVRLPVPVPDNSAVTTNGPAEEPPTKFTG